MGNGHKPKKEPKKPKGAHEGKPKAEGKLGSDTDPNNIIPWDDGNASSNHRRWRQTIERLGADNGRGGWGRGGEN